MQVDYEISRKEGESKELTFHPDDALKKIGGNAVYLEAPNAKGKSSLLNILAIAMYGHKLEKSDSRISPTLKSNIEYMMQRDDQKFAFDVRFSSKDESIQLVSSKSNPNNNDIIIREINNGHERVLPFQVFKDEYYLVYDIPENPLNRLREIIAEVEHQQERYKKKVSDFKNYLEEIKEELARSRDENAIHALKTNIANYSGEIESLNARIKEIDEKVSIIEPFHALREFVTYAKLSVSLTDRIKRKETEFKKFEKTKKRHSTVYSNKKQEIERMIDSTVQQISILSTKLGNIFIESGDMRLHIEELQGINFYRALDTYRLDPAINGELKYILEEINRYQERKEIKEAGQKGAFFEDILEILENYRGIDISIPGTDKSIEDLIKVIRTEYDKNKDFVDIYSQLNNCGLIVSQVRQTLTRLPKQLESLKIAFHKQKEMSEAAPEPQNIDDEIGEMAHVLADAANKVDKYTQIAEKYGYDVNNMDETTIQGKMQQVVEKNNQYLAIFQQDEAKISKILEECSNSVTRLTGEISLTQQKKLQYEQRLSDLENREKHKYDAYVSQIEEISSIVDSLEYDLIHYNKILDKIDNGEKLEEDLEIRYNDLVSQYLALKIPEFPYIDEFVKPKMIDFTRKKIYIDSGREIDMKDISTGQAMSMYIQAILNRPLDDRRKLIVIFDEASTMDSNSFQPIKRTLEHLIEKNKLIFAMFARAVDGDMKLTKIV
nr:AAA family ATPase [Methanoculleus sp.]